MTWKQVFVVSLIAAVLSLTMGFLVALGMSSKASAEERVRFHKSLAERLCKAEGYYDAETGLGQCLRGARLYFEAVH